MRNDKARHGGFVWKLGAPVIGLVVLVFGAAALLDAHDLFLKPAQFFLAPRDSLNVAVLNGTFTTSEAALTPERLRDLSLAGPDGNVVHPSASTWKVEGKTSRWRLGLGASGTYVVGAAVFPRELRLEAKDFNAYLAEDGLPDVLADRRARGELNAPARERYSKHVKTIVQVGGQRNQRVDVAFGHAAELIPLANPYSTKRGGSFPVRAVVDGKPIASQVVLAGGHTSTGKRFTEQSVRTDSLGVARVNLSAAGVWYIKFIRMQRVDAAARDSVDYESKWATLTFAIR